MIARTLPASLAFAAIGFCAATPAHALRVSVSAGGTGPGFIYIGLGDNNGGDAAVTSAQYSLVKQDGVPDSSPPLFYLYQLDGKADSRSGTLKSMVTISNTGGSYSGSTGEVTSRVIENFQIRPGSVVGGVIGTSGVGSPGDGYVSVLARSALNGSLFAGSPTGIPEGAEPGSARASSSLGMGQYNSSNNPTAWGQIQLQDNSGLARQFSATNDGRKLYDTGPLGLSPLTEIGYLSVNAQAGTVEMLIKEDWVLANATANGNNTFFTFSHALLAAATVGNFAGAQAMSDYSSTAYFDLDVEVGYSLKTNSSNFLDGALLDTYLNGNGQGSGAVSLPGTLALVLSAGLFALTSRRLARPR